MIEAIIKYPELSKIFSTLDLPPYNVKITLKIPETSLV